ncbi:ATP-binding protein, partial [Ensifer sp. Root954]|uniref:ATP-binding protein n=1 Tax=Ensifer sp. Root954 TaxID=1736611 RepID=UPI001FCDD8A7
ISARLARREAMLEPDEVTAMLWLKKLGWGTRRSWDARARRYSDTSRRVAGAGIGDPVVATAILDRLLHHSHVITIRGDSYRLREKRRSGLLQKVHDGSRYGE